MWKIARQIVHAGIRTEAAPDIDDSLRVAGERIQRELLDTQACQLYRARGRFELRGAKQPVTLQAPVAWKLVD